MLLGHFLPTLTCRRLEFKLTICPHQLYHLEKSSDLSEALFFTCKMGVTGESAQGHGVEACRERESLVSVLLLLHLLIPAIAQG